MTTRSILITGCSSGIGYDAAHTLSRRGWQVVASCRSQADCDRLAGEGLASVRIDYQDEPTITAGLDAALSLTGGRLDALFNNGAWALPGAVEDIPTDGFRALFEANFFGWHTLTRAVLPVMRAQGAGRIVQCSSVLGFAALRMRAPYIASKFALEGYSDTLRLELDGTGIHVVLIEPGPIRTAIRENARAPYERWTVRTGTPWEGFYRATLEPRLYDPAPPPDRFELQVEAVTAKLIHALEAPRPRARYFVTTPTYMIAALKRILPTRWLDRILIRG